MKLPTIPPGLAGKIVKKTARSRNQPDCRIWSILPALNLKKKLCYFYCRHIFAALHFNFNLHREDKVNKDGTVPLKVSYPKFKNGEATIRTRKVEQNFGK